MELGLPLVALAGLYIASNQKCKNKSSLESFENLPNVDVPNRNYPQEYPVVNPTDELTSKLSTVNKFDGGVYTDKYFNPNSKSSLLSTTTNMFSAQVPNPQTAQYVSLTGESVGSDYFQHNNMAPFFGSHLRTIRTDANATESMMDSYTGSGSQIITKKEVAPMFAPQEHTQWAYGAPNMSDFYQSRVNPSNKMSNVKPFAEQHVAPGIGAGYGTEGTNGYNSGLMAREMYMPRTVDQLRTDNNPKAGSMGLYGHEGPANSVIKERGILGQMEKNHVDTSFEMGRDRLFTTMGGSTAPTSRAIHMLKDGARQDTTAEYIGGASASAATYVEGEYMPSKHMDLGAVPITPAYRNNAYAATDADYGNKAQLIYQNYRFANDQDTYYGAFGGAIGAVIAPLLDALRPSRKENTVGTLRPYQNAKTTVNNSYVFDPTNKLPPTIREMTENSTGHLFVNRSSEQNGGAYMVSENQPITNNRMTQSDYYYAGIAGDGVSQARTYDAEYNQRNNDVKSSTLASYTPAGNMGLFSGDINMSAKPKDIYQTNTRAVVPTMPVQTPSPAFMGQPSSYHQSTTFNSNIQLDRTQPDIMSQLKGNPFAISHLNGL